MKKRILALLLAGLLTASFTSCITTSSKDPKETKTEQLETRGQNDPVVDPTKEVYQTVDETVYVTTGTLNLRTSTTSTVGAKQVKQLTELHRVKYSASWSVVEYEGTQYYAASKYLTTDDVFGRDFAPCTPVTMYVATDSLNMRKYPSSDSSFSSIMGGLKQGDAVTVVATGGNWSKIRVEVPAANEGDPATTAEYFVYSKYLSLTQTKAQEIDYSVFTDCPEKIMYVTGSLYLRAAPTLDANLGVVIDTLAKGQTVTVVATGRREDINWCKIKVADKVKEGDPQTYSFYYASSKYLSATEGSTAMTLTDMLNEYPTFTASSVNMFATGTVNIRTSPSVEGSNNLAPDVKPLSKKDPVTVVATGKVDDVKWAMIEYSTGVFYFVSAKYLTTDPNGEATAMTKDELIDEYDLTPVSNVLYIAKSKANCYSQPKVAETYAKQLAAGTQITVVAKGTVNGADWILFEEAGGALFFAGQSLFTVAN